jgi:hypothetical protein
MVGVGKMSNRLILDCSLVEVRDLAGIAIWVGWDGPAPVAVCTGRAAHMSAEALSRPISGVVGDAPRVLTGEVKDLSHS